jgi:hypothetical protein
MSNHNIVQNVSTTTRNLTGAGVSFPSLSGPFDAREVYAIVRYDGATGPASGAVHTLSFGAVLPATGYGNIDVNWGMPISFNPTYGQSVTTQKFLLPAIDAGGTFTAGLKSNNAGDTAVHVGFSIIDASSITQARFETELGYTATVAGRIDAAISSVSGGGGSSWTGLFPPREMSGDRIGFSHPDSGTFYYLVNNAADATPTTFTGTSSGSTRSVLRTTVATDVADGFSVLTVYKQAGGSVVHASDTPVGAILVNKTAGVVTERLLTQTELDAIRVVSVDATEVADRYTFKYPRNGSGTTATNRITVRTDYAGPIAFDLSSVIYNGSTIASITSVTASGGVTPGNNRVHVSRRKVLTTISSVATPGTYTLTLVCTTADSQTVKVTGTIVVQ